MARHRRLSASGSPEPEPRASPNRRVGFKRTLISGPSGSGLQPTAASATSSEGSDIEDEGLHHAQLQSDLSQITQDSNNDPQKDDSPDVACEFWHSLQPDAWPQFVAAPFETLTCAPKDYRVCKGMNFLVDEIVHFAQDKAGKGNKNHSLDDLLIEENKELIRYIGCIAQGGSKGKEGWKKLVSDETCRQALMIGVIGRALEEHVFSELFFGGDPALIEHLERMEQEQVDDEGFSRTKSRGEAITPSKPDRKVASFHKQVEKTTNQLVRMLDGFFDEDRALEFGMYSIVYHAGQLSRMMRMASNVVYYWPPTFKDEEYEPSRMEAYNLAEMIGGSPYDKKTVNGRERAILKTGKEDQSEAIVRVVCFPGLVAYRRLGGGLARREIAAEQQGIPVPADVQEHRRRVGEQPLGPDQGIRSRVVRKSLVLLQWGKQRLLTKEAGTSAHIDAARDGNMEKYDADYAGFVELYDLAERTWDAAAEH